MTRTHNCIIRKLLVITLLLLMAGNLFSQKFYFDTPYSHDLSFCYYYDGYWGNWIRKSIYYIEGNYNGFVIFLSKDHPSKYFFKFSIPDRQAPTKKEIKFHYKNNIWWVYNGYVEYYVCDVYPTFKDCIKQLGRPLRIEDLQTEEYKNKLSLLKASCLSQGKSFSPIGLTKKHSSATIKIAPYKYKDAPQCYNFYFDGVGFGIDFMGGGFWYEYPYKTSFWDRFSF